MCSKKRRQRRAEAAALTAAVASLNNNHHSEGNSTARGILPQTAGVVPAVPQENPPPYPYTEKHPVLDKKGKPLEPTYDSVTRDWLGTAGQQGRRPSFNAYHSFDTRPAPVQVQDVR